MQDDPNDMSHLQPVPFAQPPQATTGFLDNFWASFEQHQHVDAAYSLQYDLYDAIAENNKRIASRYGSAFTETSFGGEDLSIIASQYTDSDLIPFYVTDSWRNATLKKFQKYNAELAQLNAVDPQIKTFDQMFQEVRAARQEYLAAGNSTYASAGVTGTVGSFLGTLGGSLDFFRDPLVFGSLFVGGAGKTVAARIATEVGVAGTAQLAQDYLFTQPMHEALGEPDVDFVGNFLETALLGGLIRGGFEGIKPGYRALEDLISPTRKFARALEQDVKAFDFGREVSIAEAIPSIRAGRAILDADEALREVNPYGTSDIATARFLRELDEVDQAFSTDQFVSATSPREPADIRGMAQERELLQSEAPKVYDRLVRAEGRLDEIQGRAGELEDFLNNRTVGDVAASLTDAETAARIKQLEEVLSNPDTPEPLIRSAELQADRIINEIGAERILKAAEDSAIKPRYELRDVRNSERRARSEFNKAAREAYAELDRIKAREFADGVVERKRAEVLGKPMASQVEADPRIEPLTSESAAAAVRTVDEAVEAIPEQADAAAKLPSEEDTHFTAPNGDEIPLDFRIELGDGTSALVREILSEIAEDDAMLNAMKVCMK